MSRKNLFEEKMKVRQCGAVLPLAMVFALMLAIIATTVMQAAVVQWYMAGNSQSFEDAFLTAQGLATELSSEPANFSLAAGVGDSNCPQQGEAPDCDLRELVTPVSAAIPEEIVLDYRIVRREPLLSKGFPFRESEDSVSSSNSFDAAIFEVDVLVDGSENRLGRSHVIQGVAMRVPAFP
jgi:hypothetical protein